MQSLQIKTGQISLNILDDEGKSRGIFRFNPEDIESAKQLLSLQGELNDKEVEFETKSKEAESADDKFKLLDELVEYFNGAIDKCFGEGSSEILFGGAKTISMYEDFFTGITPYYQEASKKRTAKYKKGGK